MSLRTFFEAYGFPVRVHPRRQCLRPGQQLYRIIPRTILFILTRAQAAAPRRRPVGALVHPHARRVGRDAGASRARRRSGRPITSRPNEIVSIRELVERICAKLGARFEDCVEIVGERLGQGRGLHARQHQAAERARAGGTRSALDDGLDECIALGQIEP